MRRSCRRNCRQVRGTEKYFVGFRLLQEWLYLDTQALKELHGQDLAISCKCNRAKMRVYYVPATELLQQRLRRLAVEAVVELRVGRG